MTVEFSLGVVTVTVEVPDGATIGDVRDAVAALVNVPPEVRLYFRNGSLASAGDPVEDGDRVEAVQVASKNG